MNNEPYIPAATLEKLETVWPEGTRNRAAVTIALPLAGNGMPEAAIFAILRSKFPADMSDRELRGVARWAINARPEPSTPSASANYTYRPRRESSPDPRTAKRSPLEHCDWWTSGAQVSPGEMETLSPVSLPDHSVERAVLALCALFRQGDLLNIVCNHLVDGEKARPQGAGRTLPRDEWVRWFRERGVPKREAGAWIRINPCNAATGTGEGGSVTDADIAAYRYVLVESDTLPVTKQLALFSKLRLPIAAVVMSGGASAHAWVRLDCQKESDYRDLARQVLATLEPFGVDQANKNPSRLCRLPESIRAIGAVNDGAQRLVWLNPDVPGLTTAALARFKETLEFPCILDKPMLPLAREAILRYEWMIANRGKLGVPTGIPKFDALTGGLKPGHTIVIAGTTGGGKTTLALHLITAALNANIGVLLFSLEMDRTEIFDLLVSARARVSRNKFNNGHFTPEDIVDIGAQLGSVGQLPLFIEDAPVIPVEQIKARSFQLKADARIGLVVVDYIQFINPGFSPDGREQQVARISHALRAMTRELQLPMVVLSQLNDEGKLRESRVIAHNANIVMVAEADGDNFSASVVKGRGIPLAEYKFKFHRLYATLEPVDDDAPNANAAPAPQP